MQITPTNVPFPAFPPAVVVWLVDEFVARAGEGSIQSCARNHPPYVVTLCLPKEMTSMTESWSSVGGVQDRSLGGRGGERGRRNGERGGGQGLEKRSEEGLRSRIFSSLWWRR